MVKAYLIATLQTDCPFPTMIRLDIYSSPATSLSRVSNNTVYAEILSYEGNSFQEALNSLYNLCMTNDAFTWTRFWLDNTLEGHKARYAIQDLLSIQQDLYKTLTDKKIKE